MLARHPFPFALNLDPGAVEQELKRTDRSMIRHLHFQSLLTSAECAAVRCGNVLPHQLEQARCEADRLSQRKAERDFQRQAELDGLIGIDLLASALAGTRCAPCQVRIDPERQRTVLRRRCVVLGPVGRSLAGRV